MNMNKRELLRVVQDTLAKKWGCRAEDFAGHSHCFIPSEERFFDMVTFGQNAVFRGNPEMLAWCGEQFMHEPARDIMDGDALFEISGKIRESGYHFSGEHVQYLYLYPEKEVAKPEGFTYRIYEGKEIGRFYADKRFDNAMTFNADHDTLAVAAYDGGEIAAMAGTDNYMEPLWQIGIDTLPEYRRRGLAAYLTKTIADECVRRGHPPYYSTWSPNIASTAVALNCGFFPAWVGYYAEKIKTD